MRKLLLALALSGLVSGLVLSPAPAVRADAGDTVDRVLDIADAANSVFDLLATVTNPFAAVSKGIDVLLKSVRGVRGEMSRQDMAQLKAAVRALQGQAGKIPGMEARLDALSKTLDGKADKKEVEAAFDKVHYELAVIKTRLGIVEDKVEKHETRLRDVELKGEETNNILDRLIIRENSRSSVEEGFTATLLFQRGGERKDVWVISLPTSQGVRVRESKDKVITYPPGDIALVILKDMQYTWDPRKGDFNLKVKKKEDRRKLTPDERRVLSSEPDDQNRDLLVILDAMSDDEKLALRQFVERSEKQFDKLTVKEQLEFLRLKLAQDYAKRIKAERLPEAVAVEIIIHELAQQLKR